MSQSILYYPDLELFSASVERICEELEAPSAPGVEFYERHNDYILYVHLLIFVALGLRAVRDPLGIRTHIDITTGLIQIADKVSSEDRAFRVERFPEIARVQFEKCLAYLVRLQALLSKSDDSKSLASAMVTSGEFQSGALPLLFLLDSTESRAIAVTPKLFEEWLAEKSIHMPANIGRKVFASELFYGGTPFADVEAGLGHQDHLDHPYGASSLLSPWMTSSLNAEKIDCVLSLLKFSVVKAPLSRAGKCAKLPTEYLFEDVFDHRMMGYFGRLRTREAIAVAESKIVEEAKRSLDKPLKSGSIDVEPIIQAVDYVGRRAEEDGVNGKRCLSKLYKWLDSIASKGVKISRRRAYILAPEPSPFADDCLSQYRHAKDLQSAFRQRIQSLPKTSDGEDLSPADIAALVVCSAALLGGVCRKKSLKAIPAALDGRIEDYDSRRLGVWCEDKLDNTNSLEQLQVLDELTSALVCRYRLKKKQRNPSSNAISKSLSEICKDLVDFDGEPYAFLTKAARSISCIEAPGLIRETASGRLTNRSLSQEAYCRLMTQSAVKDSDEVLKKLRKPESGGDIWCAGDSDAEVDVGHSIVEFESWLRGKRKEIETSRSVKAKGNKSRDKPILLAEAIRRRYGGDLGRNFPSIVVSAASFICRLCEQGTSRKSKLAWRSTLPEYSDIAWKILLKQFSDVSLIDLTEAEFEDRYYYHLSGMKKSANKCFWIMRELHHHLMDLWQLDNVEWSYIASANARLRASSLESIDANIVTYREYQDALQLVLNQDHVADGLKYKIALLVVLGYRFGLRWSEALFLEYRDLRVSPSEEFIEIRIRENIHRKLKTRSAPRVLPLIGKLSDVEQMIIRCVRDFSSQTVANDSRGLLFNNGQSSRQIINRVVASSLANNALRLVSGDSTLRYHHLRHTTAMRMMEMAFSVLNNGQISRFGEQLFLGLKISESDYSRLWLRDSRGFSRMRLVCDYMGHANIVSTVISYTHQLSAYSQQDLLGCKNTNQRLWVAGTGLSFDVVRKRRSRVNDELPEDGVSLNLLLAEEYSRIVSDPRPPGRIRTDTQLLPKKGGALNLTDLDSVCVSTAAYGFRSQRTESLCLMLGVDTAKFVAAGLLAERSTGVDLYRFIDIKDEQISRNQESRDIGNHQENTRLRKLCGNMQAALSKLAAQDFDLIRSGIEAWGRSGVGDVSLREFVLPTDLSCVNAMLEMVGLKEVSLSVIGDNDIQQRREQIHANRAAKRENAGSWRGRGFLVDTRIPSSVRTRKTLERALLLTSIKLEYDLLCDMAA